MPVFKWWQRKSSPRENLWEFAGGGNHQERSDVETEVCGDLRSSQRSMDGGVEGTRIWPRRVGADGERVWELFCQSWGSAVVPLSPDQYSFLLAVLFNPLRTFL